MKKLLLIGLSFILLIVGCDLLQEQDCAGVAGGSAVTDSCDTCDADSSNDCVKDNCGVWGGSGTNSNGWVLATNNKGENLTCGFGASPTFYEKDEDYIYVEGDFPTWESCAEECETTENCTGIEYYDGSIPGVNIDDCALWLNGSCDILNDGCLEDCHAEAGQGSFYTYYYTGICDCDGNVLDCSDTCGGDGLSCFSVSDLEGAWSGDITVVGAPNSGIYPWIISFDDQGNCIESFGATSVGGNLAVSENREITGIITAKYDTEYGEQTDNINFEGSIFISKTQISLDVSDCNWSNTSGNSGSYSFTGILNKTN